MSNDKKNSIDIGEFISSIKNDWNNDTYYSDEEMEDYLLNIIHSKFILDEDIFNLVSKKRVDLDEVEKLVKQEKYNIRNAILWLFYEEVFVEVKQYIEKNEKKLGVE